LPLIAPSGSRACVRVCARNVIPVALLAAAACSSPSLPDTGGDTGACSVGFLGDRASAPNFDIQVLLADDTVAIVHDGDSVPMLLPPQGGRVVFVGVHATNVDGCALQLTGALRDLATGNASVDSRTINLTPTGDGWGSSAASTSTSGGIAGFSNVPACPNNWSATDLYGHSYGLEVTIQDREKRELTKKIQVTLACGQPENLGECQCICSAAYVLGQACEDGGHE
jgi:hypothetical protein